MVEEMTKRRQSIEPKQGIMPSASVLDLLESFGKLCDEDEGDCHHNENSPSKVKPRPDPSEAKATRRTGRKSHTKFDPSGKKGHVYKTKLSEPSSISTGSAKPQQLEPENEKYLAEHGELEHEFPPKEIRCRSTSRGGRKKMEPEEQNEDVRKSSRQNRRRSCVHPVLQKKPTHDDHRRRMSEGEHVRKQKVSHQSTKSSGNRGRKSTVGGSFRPNVPSVEERRSSWAAHRARAGERSTCKNVETRPAGRPRRQSSSACKSLARSTARSAASKRRSSSRAKQKCKGASSKRGESKGWKSKETFNTSCTHSISLSSSDEFNRKQDNHTTQEEAEPVVIHSKLDSKQVRQHGDLKDSDEHNGISFISIPFGSDDDSDASSISLHSYSSNEESSTCTDYEEEEEEVEDDKLRSVCLSKASRKDRAVKVLKDVKGGAVGFVGKGKSVFGELRGAQKKWQSALFI